MLKKTKQTKSAAPAGMHPGSVNLVGMLRKMAPFLFAKKKKVQPHEVAAKRTAAKPVHHAKAKPHPHALKGKEKESKPKGSLVVAKKEEKMTDDQVAATKEALMEEEGFMQKVVKTGPTATITTPKKSLWSMFARAPKEEDALLPAVLAPAAQEEKLTQEELKDDQFLKHVEQKRSDSVVGTATDDPDAPPPPDLGIRPKTALEAFAGGTEQAPSPQADAAPVKGKIISAAQLKKEAQDAKEAATRIARQTEKEMKEEQENKEAGKKEEPAKDVPPPVPHAKRVGPQQSNGFQKFIASVGHFGMGKERMQFIENLATMLNAGLPLIDALRTLGMETRNKGFRKIIIRITETVENGTPLWRAMDAEDLFSLHAIALVRIGEEAGNLAKNMEYLAAQETKDHELVQKVKMAMIYPSIVMVIMFVIVMGLGMFVLPNLIGVLTSLNVELPFITRMVIKFSDVFSAYGLIIAPGSILGMGLFVVLAKYTVLKVPVQWLVFRIPGIGSLLRSATIARFGVIVGGLLKAGVPVVDAVQSLVEVTPILVYRRLYEKLRDHITIGDSFSKSFAAIKGSQKLLPVSVQQLVVTGEKSGALADIMLKVADIYDKKASETAQKLPVILEPILLLIIGTLVGTIAFAIIVPIYSIVGNVGR
ncbi:type II secretion system F family protein [Candidatus Peribacteria bacterium]|nr:MAG: type II secretion system F family protein [Candidatus Peribacteria bacterium]